MTTMTIHAEDDFATALREHARRQGKSVNQTVKDVFAPILGLVAVEESKNPFMRFYGAAAREIDAEGWTRDLAEMRKVDEGMWK